MKPAAEELVNDYLEDSMPQRVWRSHLMDNGVKDVDGVLEDAYGGAREYHNWLAEEVGDVRDDAPGRGGWGMGGVAVLGLAALLYYFYRRRKNGP